MNSLLKKIFLLFFFILISNFIFPADKINIALSQPYTRTVNAETYFFQKHFIFELFYSYPGEKYELEILNVDTSTTEEDYLTEVEAETLKNNFDYLLYSVVYTNNSYLFFKVNLINPKTNNIILSQLFITKKDYTLSDYLSETSSNVVKMIDGIQLTKNTIKINKTENKKTSENKLEAFIPRYKHEIFILSSFFKNHASTMSFLELYSGYNFSPFTFFSIEGGFFFGYGNKSNLLELVDYKLNSNYIGTFGSFYFFLPLVVEPNIGMRFELNYLINTNNLYISLPFDMGLKIYITPKDAIRINSSFHFSAYNINKLIWENNFIVGFMIGYARKI